MHHVNNIFQSGGYHAPLIHITIVAPNK